MASTVQTIVDRLRVRLEESTARKWSDADQLIPYTSQAERWLARMLSRIPKSHRFRVVHETFTNPANTSVYDLTGLAKRFDWLVSLSVLVGNVEVPVFTYEDGDDPHLRNLSLGGGAIIPRVDIQDDNLILLPTFGAARTMYISYGWIPSIKTSAGADLQTPQEYDEDVACRALHFALSDAGLANTKFEEQYAARLNEIEDLERSRLGIREQKVVGRSRVYSRVR